MKICRICGCENANSSYMCEKCGNPISGDNTKELQKTMSITGNKIKMCHSCNMSNNATERICKFCSSPLPNEIFDVEKEKKYKDSDLYGKTHEKTTVKVIIVIVLTYAIVLTLAGLLEFFAVIYTWSSVVVGWVILTMAENKTGYTEFLSNFLWYSAWFGQGDEGCTTFVISKIVKFFVSFFVGLFFTPFFLGRKIADIIFE